MLVITVNTKLGEVTSVLSRFAKSILCPCLFIYLSLSLSLSFLRAYVRYGEMGVPSLSVSTSLNVRLPETVQCISVLNISCQQWQKPKTPVSNPLHVLSSGLKLLPHTAGGFRGPWALRKCNSFYTNWTLYLRQILSNWQNSSKKLVLNEELFVWKQSLFMVVLLKKFPSTSWVHQGILINFIGAQKSWIRSRRFLNFE
jgi:hypothetical protein